MTESTQNLNALRSNITIIPQTPELISDGLGEARLTLDSNITISGGNISVGERQILALARAIVRQSKVLILDEATSTIGTFADCKTDTVIQETLRHKLGLDVTVITVAHCLRTVMDADKIMVLSEGHLIEFDAPQNLLSVAGSIFKALVDGSGDRDMLCEMVAS